MFLLKWIYKKSDLLRWHLFSNRDICDIFDSFSPERYLKQMRHKLKFPIVLHFSLWCLEETSRILIITIFLSYSITHRFVNASCWLQTCLIDFTHGLVDSSCCRALLFVNSTYHIHLLGICLSADPRLLTGFRGLWNIPILQTSQWAFRTLIQM